MHIAVNLGVQKIASFQVDNFLAEELDHELNIAMDRFIKQRYNPRSNRLQKGFEQSQKRIDDLRHLVVEAGADAFFNGESISSDNTFFKDRAAFPNDYLFLISLRAGILDKCEPAEPILTSKELKFQRISLTPPVTGYVLKKINMVLYSGDNGVDVIHNPDGLEFDALFNSSAYSASIVPVLSVQEASTSETVQQSPTVDSNELFLKVDPEQYDGDLTTVLTWIHPIDGTESTVTMETPTLTTIATRTFAGEARRKLVKCNYCQLDDIYTVLDDPFNTTKAGGPKYTIQENFVDIHTNEEFLVEEVTFKYIRRPQRMSRPLGVGCGLPEHTHQEIVEMAIKSILEGIQDPRYQSQSGEVLESE